MFSAAALANTETAQRPPETTISIVTSQDAGTELQLEVKQAPLADVLNQIAVKTQVPIHYSILPESPVFPPSSYSSAVWFNHNLNNSSVIYL